MDLNVVKHAFYSFILLVFLFGVAYVIPDSVMLTFVEKELASLERYYINFDTSMDKDTYSFVLENSEKKERYDLFKQLYEEKSFRRLIRQSNVKIPKIIHMMWLGGQLPEQYEPFVLNWYERHPEWNIVFWTDSSDNFSKGSCVVRTFTELEQLLKEKGKRIVVDLNVLEPSSFYKPISILDDRWAILKWEILYRFGGAYVAPYLDCCHTLDLLHHTYDFYSGLAPLATNNVEIGEDVCGASRHHPIMKRCMTTIQKNDGTDLGKNDFNHLTKCYVHCYEKSNLIDIVFPTSYFYFVGNQDQSKNELVENLKSFSMRCTM